MEPYMYTMNTRIRYSEVNEQNLLEPASVINYFQDLSLFHSADAGAGLDYFEKMHRIWMLSAWQVEFFSLPGFGEAITLATWPYDFNSVYACRNFLLMDKEEKPLAAANSVWIMVDTQTGLPLKITNQDTGFYQLGEKYPMDYAPRKIRFSPAAVTGAGGQLLSPAPYKITASDIDTNHHVNNGSYVRIAGRYLPADFKTKRLRVEYRKAAAFGDIIYPSCLVQNTEGNQKQFLVSLSDESQAPYAVIEFTA